MHSPPVPKGRRISESKSSPFIQRTDDSSILKNQTFDLSFIDSRSDGKHSALILPQIIIYISTKQAIIIQVLVHSHFDHCKNAGDIHTGYAHCPFRLLLPYGCNYTYPTPDHQFSSPEQPIETTCYDFLYNK